MDERSGRPDERNFRGKAQHESILEFGMCACRVRHSPTAPPPPPPPPPHLTVPSTHPFLCSPHNFKAAPGAEIFSGVFLGKFLGAGVQAAVYELVFADGTTTGRVLKLGHESLSHRIFLGGMATSMMSLQKEWEIGMQLKAAIEEEEGKLPGFTRTCDCMAIHTDNRSKQVVFRGLMMEKINGFSVAARVTDPCFANIHYIREMLYQVFSALDTAQRRTGFCHADLGLNNVMVGIDSGRRYAPAP